MLNGFRDFFARTNRTYLDTGLRELARLESSHFLVARSVDHDESSDYFTSIQGFSNVNDGEVVTATTLRSMASSLPAGQDVVVGIIPKRWFSKKEISEGASRAINRLLPWGPGNKMPANYIWGLMTKWDDTQEEFADTQFLKNINYHAHDGLLETWKKGNPQPVRPTPSLDRPTPRHFAPHSPTYGHKTFHGYNDVEFQSP